MFAKKWKEKMETPRRKNMWQIIEGIVYLKVSKE